MRFKLGILSVGLFAAAHGAFAAPTPETVRVIIKYKQQPLAVASLKAQLMHTAQLPVQEMKPMANGAFSLILDSSHATFAPSGADLTEMVLEKIRKNPNVLYAVKDRVGYFKPVPDPIMLDKPEDLSHSSQWNQFSRPGGVLLESAPGLRDGAWSYTTGKSTKEPIVVAVLDTGIAQNEGIVNSLVKDSNGKIFGWNFAGNNDDLTDETKSYHGTHVAGIIAGYGPIMQGIGQDLQILTLKIPGEAGMFYESSVVNAIYWSVGVEVPGVPTNPYPAKVLNMSFGVDEKPGKEIDYCDEALQEAVFYARKKGAVLAVAAGNDDVWEHFNAPGVCNGTLKVASTGPKGLRSYFSNYGPSVTFAAPGGDKHYGRVGAILSTVNPGGGYQRSGYDFYQGTSMASPHVAGVAGLVMAAAGKDMKAEKVEQILYTTTHNFGKSKDDDDSCVGKKPCGHGIIDAKNAVQAVVEDFDVLLSSPTWDTLGSSACGKGLVQPGSGKVVSGDAVWIPVTRGCQQAIHYQNPHITKTKNGKIYAHYGRVSYELDQSGFKSCQVIGYDGVGCHR